MKKTLGKTFLIICICALLIFLLLPFLETQQPAAEQAKKASPQIFTSNPLTALVNRLASIFQTKEKRLQKQAALARAQAQAAQKALNELYADVPADVQARYSAQLAQNEGTNTPNSPSRFDYGDAALQDDQGNWVLVRQTVPQAAGRGMHEINATDDAYERYIRQERAARSTPGLDEPARPADSALARILTPLKNLFGKNQTASAPLPEGQNPTMLAQGRSEGLGGNQNKEVSSQPSAQKQPQMPDFTLAAIPASSAGRGAAAGTGGYYSGADLFNPMLTITRASDWILNNQDEDASDEEKKNNSQKLKAIISKTREELSSKLTEQVQEEAGDAPSTDRLPSTIGCQGQSGSFYRDDLSQCDLTPSITQDPSAWMNEEQQKKQNQLGKQQLTEKLNLPAGHPSLPDVNVLVVLGKTKNILPPDVEEDENDTPEAKQEKQVVAKIYELMLEKQNCSKQECYWIPNKIQQYPNVRETLISAGVNSVEDPLNLYNKWVPELEEKLMDETEGDETGKRFMAMRNALSANAPAYIPVTRQQMQELNRRNEDRKLMNPQTRKDHIVFYVPDPQNARDMMDTFQEHPAFLVWGKDGQVFDKSANLDTGARAGLLQDDLTRRAKEMASFAQGVVQELYKENLIDTSRRKASKIGQMDTKQAAKELNKMSGSATGKTPAKTK